MKKKLAKHFFMPLLAAVGVILLITGAVLAEARLVVDEAGLFSAEVAASLEAQARESSAQTGMTLAVVTTSDAAGKTAREYADDYFDEAGYSDGALLLIDMDNREAYISTGGGMIDILTDLRMEALLDDVFKKLPEEDYAGAAFAFLSGAVGYIELGVPQNQYRAPQSEPAAREAEAVPALSPEQQAVIWLIGSIALALAAGGVCVYVVLKGYTQGSDTTKYPFREQSRMLLTGKSDLLVNQYVTTRVIKTETTAGGSSGRSTTHTSGSGKTHGGGGRKF